MAHDHLATPATTARVAAYAIAIVACAVVTLLTFPFRDTLDLANAVMLFLLVVFLVALKLGRGPAVLAAFLGVALFDFFLVPPHFTFAVSNSIYLITFAVMLAVGLLTTQLTASLQEEVGRVRRHEKETRDLYELARRLTGAASLLQIEQAVASYMQQHGCHASLFLLDADGKLDVRDTYIVEHHLLQVAFASEGAVIGETESGAPPLYLPLRAPMHVHGVLAVYPQPGVTIHQQQALFATLASLLAIAIERLHYVAVANQEPGQQHSDKLP